MQGFRQELENKLNGIAAPDYRAIKESENHWLNIAKPLKSFGKFEEMITKIAGIKGNAAFSLDKKAVIVMCADNGIVEENVTQTDQHMTRVVTENFLKGDTSVCNMARVAGADVFPVDIGVKEDIPSLSDKGKKIRNGTGNIVKECAMTEDEAIRAVLTGIAEVKALKEKGYDIIGTGEMGIGNTSISSAVTSVCLGVPAEEITGPGAGLSSDGVKRKIEAIKKAIAFHSPDKDDAIDILHKIGGLDIAGLTGVFIGGAVYRVPIVIDGFISAAAALLAYKVDERTRDYMLPSHASKEGGSKLIMESLGLSPVICADMFTGEGTGAVALFPLLDMVLAVYNDMVTFDNWNGHQRYELQDT